MILINGEEIINNVTIKDNSIFETIDMSSYFGVSNKINIEKKYFIEKRIPYIEYPSSVYINYRGEINHIDDVRCQMGYINTDNGQKDIKPIKIGNIEIKELAIKTKAHYYENRYGHGVNLHFHYEFIIKICMEDDKYIEHKFMAETKQQLQQLAYFHQNISYDFSPIKILFRNIVPLLNKCINLGIPIKQINFAYLSQLLPQKEKNNYTVHPFCFSDALDIVYSLQLIENKGHITIEIGKKLEPYLNLYIISLINSILNVNLQIDEKTRTYRSNIPEHIEYPRDIISLRNFLQCLLFIGIYENFNVETSRKKYMIIPDKQNRNRIELPKNYLKDYPKEDFLGLFDFIADMEATHIEDGQTRVGRDDYEWKEKTFIIPFKKNFSASDIFVNKINELLEIKLEFQKERKSENSWNADKDHPARYYYFEEYDKDRIGGLACSRHDIGSSKLKKESFYKLLDYFIKKYIS